jgi:hypothetical protein
MKIYQRSYPDTWSPFILFERLEVHWRSGVWRRPSEWVWDFVKYEDGCLFLELGCINFMWWHQRNAHAE